MSPTSQDDAQKAWEVLVSLVMESMGDWRRNVSEITGMPFSRYRALKRLRTHVLILRDLAQGMGIDTPAASVLVDDLETRGLVARRPHPADRRAKQVSLTAAGRKVLAAVDKVENRPPAALAALPSKDLAQLWRIVEKLVPKEDR
jgi:DNA-binding MarR family transcriptional regulator